MAGPVQLSDALTRFPATGEARRRIFCLPFAGGGPAAFRLWPRALPDDVEVLAVRLPGRSPSSREPLLDSAADIVAWLLPAMRSADELPFVIFGHSMGALLAYELTIALEADGARPPERLFVSGRGAPDEPAAGRTIHTLADGEFLDELDRSYGGIPAVVRNEPDLLTLLLPALRADVRVFETYAPLSDRRVACPLHVYGGRDDRHPRPAELAGWQRLAQHEITVRTFPGDHFYMTDAREALTLDIAQRWSGLTSRAAPT
jgi:medium-chain acyl-[acyl-carrier-protein] hydrolase